MDSYIHHHHDQVNCIYMDSYSSSASASSSSSTTRSENRYHLYVYLYKDVFSFSLIWIHEYELKYGSSEAN